MTQKDVYRPALQQVFFEGQKEKKKKVLLQVSRCWCLNWILLQCLFFERTLTRPIRLKVSCVFISGILVNRLFSRETIWFEKAERSSTWGRQFLSCEWCFSVEIQLLRTLARCLGALSSSHVRQRRPEKKKIFILNETKGLLSLSLRSARLTSRRFVAKIQCFFVSVLKNSL